MQKTRLRTAVLSLGVVVASCGPGAAVTAASSCTEPTERCALQNTKRSIQQNLDLQAEATAELCAAAPAQNWPATTEAAALTAMKAAWKKARHAYERCEGAIAVLYPELDASVDERYDAFLEHTSDTNLFDDEGVIGSHAIERILWAGSHPQFVIDFERETLGAKYVEARWPSTDEEARDFKKKLCARWVSDTQTMRDDFAPLALDAPAAFRGVIGSMAEQLEKVNLAASGEEESRYAEFTLADMRGNLEAGQVTWAAFKPWLLTKDGGALVAEQTDAAFARTSALYSQYSSDAIPQPPSTWSSQNPSDADKQTPFGRLFVGLRAEADDGVEGSLHFSLNRAAELLGIAQIRR